MGVVVAGPDRRQLDLPPRSDALFGTPQGPCDLSSMSAPAAPRVKDRQPARGAARPSAGYSASSETSPGGPSRRCRTPARSRPCRRESGARRGAVLGAPSEGTVDRRGEPPPAVWSLRLGWPAAGGLVMDWRGGTPRTQELQRFGNPTLCSLMGNSRRQLLQVKVVRCRPGHGVFRRRRRLRRWRGAGTGCRPFAEIGLSSSGRGGFFSDLSRWTRDQFIRAMARNLPWRSAARG